LLGSDYPYLSEVDEVTKIAENINLLYQQWLINAEDLKLNRPDLEAYVSLSHLKDVFENLKN
jgi:hypothetical protein